MLPAAYVLHRETNLADGLSAIATGGLYLGDETLSRVQPFFDSDRTPDGANPATGEQVLGIWLVHPKDQPARAVGMATVSWERVEQDESRPHRYALLSLYVHPNHAGQGLGAALLAAAKAAYPELVGFYNQNTVALYERAGVRDVIWMDRDPTGQDAGVAEVIARRHQKLHTQRWSPDPHGLDRPHHGRPTFTTPSPSAPAPEAPAPDPSLRRTRLR
jgi:GNAT superfamily N-acetyltransferase